MNTRKPERLAEYIVDALREPSRPATVAGRALLAWENSAEDSEEACIALFGRHWEPSDAILAIEDEARAAAESQREALDVGRLIGILIDAENDDQMGVEYRPERLAEYIVDALREQPRWPD